MLPRKLYRLADADLIKVSMRNKRTAVAKCTNSSAKPFIYAFVWSILYADNLKLPRSPGTRARRDIVAKRCE